MKHTRTVVAITTALAATALLAGCGKTATTTDHMMAPSPSDTMMHSTMTSPSPSK